MNIPVEPTSEVTPQTQKTSNDDPTAALDLDLRSHPTRSDSKVVTPSECSCSNAPAATKQKVFALGKLSFDYGTRSRRLYFANAMKQALGTDRLPNIDDPAVLYQYLTRRSDAEYSILEGKQFAARSELSSITWTLEVDQTPIYAISPAGPFAYEIHDALVEFLKDQIKEGAERVSVPGVLSGTLRLYTGEAVPVIAPDMRGMFSWTTSALVAKVKAAAGADDDAAAALQDFLSRVYDLTRNLGVSSQERAINYAATDALMLQGIFNDIRTKPKFQGLELDTFSVRKSPICRWDFDCWDVQVLFYDAENLHRARRGFRYTVDVSDVMPVLVGQRQEFSIR